MKTAAIMSRVSSDEQAKGYSLDDQEEALRKYCQRNDITIAYSFREDHSAKSFDRPKFKEFQLLIKTGKLKVDLFLFRQWDRFSRNTTDAFVMLRWLDRYGVDSNAIDQPIDRKVPESLAMLGLYLTMPEIDNTRRSMKIRGGIRQALKSGHWVRKAPVGYKNSRDQQNTPIIIPSEKASLVKLAFTSIASGRAQPEVRQMLKKKGLDVSKSNLSRMLRNPVYTGKIVVPASEDEPEKLVNGLHESIVPEPLFFKVQGILSGRAHTRNKPKFHTKRPELPLRGSLLCSKCGSHLTGSASRSKTGELHFYYHCNHCKNERYRAGMVNESVSALVKSLKFNGNADQLYKMILKDVLKEKHIEQDTTVDGWGKKLDELNQRLVKLQDMLVDGTVSKDDYIQMKTRYEADRSKIELSLKQMKTDDRSLQVKLDKCFKVLSRLDELYEKADHDHKKQLVSSIFPEKIVFDGKESRTPRLNEELRLSLLSDAGSGKKKTGQRVGKTSLSRQVEHTGVEPVISRLRT